MDPRPKAGSRLIIGGASCDIDWPVITFLDEGGHNAGLETCTGSSDEPCPGGLPHSPAKSILHPSARRIRPRRITQHDLRAAQETIKQVVVHLDGCPSAAACFNVLHNERGLSCHLLVDNDGTIFQTCDLVACALHAAGMNETSIGVELCNRGDAAPKPDYYDGSPDREQVVCTINGHRYLAFDFTPRQYLAMEALGRCLTRYLPGIKLDYPQSSPGVQSWDTLPYQKLKDYSGYLGHYHITERKWDPGPFDFKRFVGKLAGRRSFPVGLHAQAKVEVPEAPRAGEREAQAAYDGLFEAYYENDEAQGGGLFPVGPLDDAWLYHGGVHLHVAGGSPVVAPLPGKVVLARIGPLLSSEAGSTSFVLLEHNLKVGLEQLSFYSLYYHLADEREARPAWMAGKGWAGAEVGKLHVLSPPEPVLAGDVIGHVGTAGPDAEPQVHWETFSVTHGPYERLDRTSFWKLYSRPSDDRFCTDKAILAHLAGDREWSRHAVTYHYSEWSEIPDWKLALLNAPGRKAGRAAQVERMVDEQIVPGLWWTEDLAALLRLPADARVYTYHPVSFMKWLNDLTARRQDPAVVKATAANRPTEKAFAMLDVDDRDGIGAVSRLEQEESKVQDLELRDLIDGFGD